MTSGEGLVDSQSHGTHIQINKPFTLAMNLFGRFRDFDWPNMRDFWLWQQTTIPREKPCKPRSPDSGAGVLTTSPACFDALIPSDWDAVSTRGNNSTEPYHEELKWTGKNGASRLAVCTPPLVIWDPFSGQENECMDFSNGRQQRKGIWRRTKGAEKESGWWRREEADVLISESASLH